MKKKSISPVIATILLIIITVGIAALIYIWTTGMFTQLTTQAEQQTGEVGAINFDLIYITHDIMNDNQTNYSVFNITLLNSGKVSLDFNRSGIFMNVEYYQKPRGNKISVACDIWNKSYLSDYLRDIKPGNTAVLTLNCSFNASTNPINPDLYRYTIRINYLGVVKSIIYG